MSLNHTIRLIEANYIDALISLAEQHYEANVVLTRLPYKAFLDHQDFSNFEDEGTLLNLAWLLSKVMNTYSTAFIQVPVNLAGVTIAGFEKGGLSLKNILTIPVEVEEEQNKCNLQSRAKFVDENLKYILFFTKLNCHSRALNCTDIMTKGKYSGVYPASWDWFKGDELSMYETLLKIVSYHRDEILDPFMGDGLIGEAVINVDRHFTGVEPTHTIFSETKDKLDCVGE